MFGSGGAMSADRRMRLWGLIVELSQGGQVTLAHVADAAISTTGVDGAAVTVPLAATPSETVYASDGVAAALAELSLTLGEGPGVDAAVGGPSLVADLATAEYLVRWPAYTSAAAGVGVRAVFAFPLRVGAIRLGVLVLHRAGPGSLDRGRLADAFVLADTACALLLDGQRPVGSVSVGSPSDGFATERAGPKHPEVHQATGMITVQLGVSAAVALTRLRAYAYAHDRRLRDVAADVVARRLRFDPDPEPELDPDSEGRGG